MTTRHYKDGFSVELWGQISAEINRLSAAVDYPGALIKAGEPAQDAGSRAPGRPQHGVFNDLMARGIRMNLITIEDLLPSENSRLHR